MGFDPETGRYGRGGRKRGNGLLLLAAFALIPAGLVVLPTTILIGVGMLPTVVAYVIDQDPEKSAPITVGAMNFCGVMPFAIGLWQAGHTLPALMPMLRDPVTWFFMYGAAGVGWLLYYGLPPMIAGVVVMRDETRIRTLDTERRALIEEWGPDVVAKTPDPADPKAAETKPAAEAAG